MTAAAGEGATTTTTTTTDDGAGSGQGSQQQQQQQETFTAPASQADLDRIVQDRLGRLQRQYGMTPDEAKAFKDRAEKVEYDLSSEHEKQLADIKKATAADVAAVFTPKLINAELRAASAGRISEEDLTRALKFVDAGAFLTDNGKDIDPAKIAEFIDSVAPAQQQTGGARVITPPRQLGQGNQQQAVAKPGDAGRAMAQKRFQTNQS